VAVFYSLTIASLRNRCSDENSPPLLHLFQERKSSRGRLLREIIWETMNSKAEGGIWILPILCLCPEGELQIFDKEYLLTVSGYHGIHRYLSPERLVYGQVSLRQRHKQFPSTDIIH
jgi:hypothetical protein